LLAQGGDVLILTKPLGVGVMTTALKKGLLPPEGYDEVSAAAGTTQEHLAWWP
jgi:selenophosphate synthase